jgi:hypothetical protein
MNLRALLRPRRIFAGIAGLGAVSFLTPIIYDKISEKDETAPCIQLRMTGINLEIKVEDDFLSCPIQTESSDGLTSTYPVYMVRNKTPFSDLKNIKVYIDYALSQTFDVLNNASSAEISTSPLLSYGKHILGIEAEDLSGNTRFVEFKLFAFTNLIVDYSKIENDFLDPEIYTEEAMLSRYGRLICSKCYARDPNGIKEFKIYAPNGKVVVYHAYKEYKERENFSAELQDVLLHERTPYIIEAKDTRGNITRSKLSLQEFDGYVMGGY